MAESESRWHCLTVGNLIEILSGIPPDELVRVDIGDDDGNVWQGDVDYVVYFGDDCRIQAGLVHHQTPEETIELAGSDEDDDLREQAKTLHCQRYGDDACSNAIHLDRDKGFVEIYDIKGTAAAYRITSGETLQWDEQATQQLQRDYDQMGKNWSDLLTRRRQDERRSGMRPERKTEGTSDIT